MGSYAKLQPGQCDDDLKPDASQKISNPPLEKGPAKDSTSGFLSFAGRFYLSLGAQQSQSAHFQYISTLLVEFQKQEKAHQKQNENGCKNKQAPIFVIAYSTSHKMSFRALKKHLLGPGHQYCTFMAGVEFFLPIPGIFLLGAFLTVGGEKFRLALGLNDPHEFEFHQWVFD